MEEINGFPEGIREVNFAELMDDSPAGRDKLIAALREGNAVHNAGCVKRTIDVPTFALRVARKSEAARFTFEKRGTDKISGVQTWEVRFGKERPPTLVHATTGDPLLSSGTLWIEPNTGQIMKTEFLSDNPYSNPAVTSRIVVTYSVNKELGMSVPSEMTEHYETMLCSVDGLAHYSNFHPFQVTVIVDIEPHAVR